MCLMALGALALLVAGLIWLVNVGRSRLVEWIPALPLEFRDPQPGMQIFGRLVLTSARRRDLKAEMPSSARSAVSREFSSS